jgi:hypothetical protein
MLGGAALSLVLLLALTSGIALCRLTAQWWPGAARLAEVAIGSLILAAGCWVGLRGWSGAPSWPWP